MVFQEIKKLNVAYLSLGSNIPDREKNLENAIKLLEVNENISLEKKSSIYETDPVGYADQEAFLNMVVKIKTSLTELQLLNIIQLIEEKGGRIRQTRWGPRTIDLDILLFNDENINLGQLKVPHPRMFERGFVLIPLFEIEPNYQFNNGITIKEYINNLTSKEGVRKWKNSIGEDASEHSES